MSPAKRSTVATAKKKGAAKRGKTPAARDTKAPAKIGRPTAYRPEYVGQVTKLAALCVSGITDAALAAFFGVTETTVNNWKLAHPAFLESLKGAKDDLDAKVERSLFERATGYEHAAVKILTVARGDNQGSDVEEVAYIERYPPDTTAAIFWLKNRQPDRWRDKSEVAHGLSSHLALMMSAAEERLAQRDA